MKFNDFSEGEQVQLLKDEFVMCVEEVMLSPENNKLISKLSDAQAKDLVNYVPELRPKEFKCNCNQCLNMRKLTGKLDSPVRPLIAIARERCLVRTY